MFNTEKHSASAIKVSLTATICNFITILLGIIYRTAFVRYFTVSYLGINGLFSNILEILAISELGLTTPIIYRLYKPIEDDNRDRVAELMSFYKKVYHFIFVFISIVGICICPFISYFINDTTDIPSEINLQYIYILFLAQTSTTYLFSYKQSLLIADRKQYVVNLYQIFLNFFKTFIQIILVIFIHKYDYILLSSIGITTISNYLFSRYITKNYYPLFDNCYKLDRRTQKDIFHEAKACFIHKVGYKLLTATDNIIISKYVGIISTGIYSNYLLIYNLAFAFVGQLVGNFVAIVGKIIVQEDEEYATEIFKRLNFLSLWINCTVSCCMWLFLDKLIELWLGPNLCISRYTSSLLAFYFFISNLRHIPNTFVGVSSLFTKDIIRPIIQTIINILVSIILVKRIEIDGVIIGSIVCVLVTVFWREPYLVFKYLLKNNSWIYWKQVISFFIPTICIGIILKIVFFKVQISSFSSLLSIGIFSFLSIQCILIVTQIKTQEYKYYLNFIMKKVYIINKGKKND